LDRLRVFVLLSTAIGFYAMITLLAPGIGLGVLTANTVGMFFFISVLAAAARFAVYRTLKI